MTKSVKLREILSWNIKEGKEKIGIDAGKTKIADLSSQTNDVEGRRMWVSDKTISKLARVLYIEAYRLLIPASPPGEPTRGQTGKMYCLILKTG